MLCVFTCFLSFHKIHFQFDMQDKHDVKCSFCDTILRTTLSAIICTKCEKVAHI